MWNCLFVCFCPPEQDSPHCSTPRPRGRQGWKGEQTEKPLTAPLPPLPLLWLTVRSHSQLLPQCTFRATPASAVTGDLFCVRGQSRPWTRDGTSGQPSGARCKHNHFLKESKTGKQKYCSWHASTSTLIQRLKTH